MPRRAAITPNRHIHTTIPAALGDRLELMLFSPVEGRVPKGAYQEFVVGMLQEHFDWKELDLSPFLGTMPGTTVIKGRPEALAVLLKKLEEDHES